MWMDLVLLSLGLSWGGGVEGPTELCLPWADVGTSLAMPAPVPSNMPALLLFRTDRPWVNQAQTPTALPTEVELVDPAGDVVPTIVFTEATTPPVFVAQPQAPLTEGRYVLSFEDDCLVRRGDADTRVIQSIDVVEPIPLPEELAEDVGQVQFEAELHENTCPYDPSILVTATLPESLAAWQPYLIPRLVVEGPDGVLFDETVALPPVYGGAPQPNVLFSVLAPCAAGFDAPVDYDLELTFRLPGGRWSDPAFAELSFAPQSCRCSPEPEPADPVEPAPVPEQTDDEPDRGPLGLSCRAGGSEAPPWLLLAPLLVIARRRG